MISYSGRLFQGWRTHLGRPPLTQGPGTAVMRTRLMFPLPCIHPYFIYLLFSLEFKVWFVTSILPKSSSRLHFHLVLVQPVSVPFGGDEGRKWVENVALCTCRRPQAVAHWLSCQQTIWLDHFECDGQKVRPMTFQISFLNGLQFPNLLFSPSYKISSST